MSPEYKCNECGRNYSQREYEKQSDIFCPDCGGHIEEHVATQTTQPDTFPQGAPQFLSDNISTNPLLIKCGSCSRQFSRRAQQCPKCGWKPWIICKVCKQNIPSDSASCPECGDPEPFDSNYAAPSSSIKAADELQHVSLNSRTELGISKGGQLGRGKLGDTASANEKTNTVKRSILIATIMTILVLFLNVSFGDKIPHIMYWTWVWLYLTAEIWNYWGCKALIPYPAYIVFGSVLAIIVAQNSSDMVGPQLAMAIANIIGIVIFYIAYRAARRSV